MTPMIRQIFFVRNLKSGALTRTNFGPLGGQAKNDSSKPDLSVVTAKRFFALAYQSQATNLSALGNLFPDTNGNTDIFLSLPTFGNLTERISVGPGAVDNGDCERAIGDNRSRAKPSPSNL